MKKYPKLCNEISQPSVIAGWAYYTFELLFLPSILLSIAAKLGIGDAVVNFVYYLLNFAFCLAIFRDFLLKSLEDAGKNLGAFLRAVALGFVAYWAVNRGVELLMELISPEFANVNDQSIAAMFAEHPALIAVGTVLLVPVAEECLFRGLIFSQLKPKNAVAAYAVSALAFCAIHVVGYVGAYPAETLALCFLQYVPAGLLLAWSYAHCGSIIAPILIHTAINAAAVLSLM